MAQLAGDALGMAKQDFAPPLPVQIRPDRDVLDEKMIRRIDRFDQRKRRAVVFP